MQHYKQVGKHEQKWQSARCWRGESAKREKLEKGAKVVRRHPDEKCDSGH